MTRFATDVPETLSGRQIEHALHARGFEVTLDTVEPWPGGRIAGRVETRGDRRGDGEVTVAARCQATWLDIAPELVGQRRFGPLTFWNVRTRGVPIWIDEDVFLERLDIGSLAQTNWLPFELDVPPHVPRPFEGTFVAFRWRIEARRPRRIGHETASLPLLIVESRTEPIVRVETSPLGTWRLLEWRSEHEVDVMAASCSVTYEARRPEDAPRPGETPEAERRRLAGLPPAASPRR